MEHAAKPTRGVALDVVLGVSRLPRAGNTRAWEAAFTSCYEAEFGRAVKLAHLLTGSNDAAEDIVQECFVKLHHHFASVEQPAAYLRRSVVNACRNWQRGRARELARAKRSVAGAVDVALLGQDHPGGDVDARVLAAVDVLPFRQRAVLVGRYWLGLSEVELAAAIGCRPGTVKSLAARALATLREELR